MKRMIIAMSLCAVMLLTGCSSVPENTVNSIEDLKGKNIGVQLKTTADIYSSDIENATVQRFNKSYDAVEALREGVIDAVMIDDAPANVFVEEFGDIRILEEPYAEEEYGIAVNKNNKELLEKINAALATLKSDGTIEQIESAWLKNGETVPAYEGQNKDSYANGNLIMVTNAEFPPYESKMEDGEIVGIDIDIMKAVCDVLDMKLQVEHTAFDALISSVERETADVAVAAMTITGERLEQVDFSDTYMKAKQVIIVRKDK